METLNRIWEAAKRIGIVIATALSAVALVLIGRETKKVRGDGSGGEVPDLPAGGGFGGTTLAEREIEERCNEKRDEAIERIGNTDARKLSENYGAVCDAIADGKLRFGRRCRELDGAGADDYGNRGRGD